MSYPLRSIKLLKQFTQEVLLPFSKNIQQPVPKLGDSSQGCSPKALN
jgi:hypothetical protein